jgi:cysteine desulfurase/selenocysteine lyase
MIYLDNAATSWPKPLEVLKAMADAMECAGGNPGRSGHRSSIAAARVIYDCREKVTEHFNASDPLRVVFTANATQAINLVLRGLLKPGDNVVTTAMEHNAVMRPLRFLEKQGIKIKIAPCASDGSLDVQQMAGLINSSIRLVVILHASNVCGTILPVEEVISIAHQYRVPVLVDCSQSAGVIPIDSQKWAVDFVAFTGHKELLGPTGTGGLIISPGFDTGSLVPLTFGGTGSRSESQEQPEELPDKYESGTLNLIGLAGFSAGLHWIKRKGIDAIRDHAKTLTTALISGLSVIPGVKVFGTHEPDNSIAVVSFTIAGKKVSEVGFRLDEEYGILSRVGLHCAPAAHRTIGSFPEGTVRLSPGIFNTMEEIDQTLQAIRKVARS